MPDNATLLAPSDTFVHRHIGPRPHEVAKMLATIGVDSLDALIDRTVPATIRIARPLKFGPEVIAGREAGEYEVQAAFRAMVGQNRVMRSLIGMGYYACITPPVIQRNILENPGWYTQYTPYQAEIAQGRLEALLNFQTVVSELTGLPLANASLLDEATAAAEALGMCFALANHKRKTFVVADSCHPHTIAVVQTRAEALGVVVKVQAPEAMQFDAETCGVLLQYPDTFGRVRSEAEVVAAAHAAGALVVLATDLLALTVLRSAGELGADIAVGSAQRFGVPLGYGGPHAAFMATREAYKRALPGRVIGVSKDATGKRAYRMAMQTREQHIRRERATSNICTAQVLLAIMAGMYAVYHGPAGLRQIGERVRGLTAVLADGLRRLGHSVGDAPFFDTLRVELAGGRPAAMVLAAAQERGFNLRPIGATTVGLSLDERSTLAEVDELLATFAGPQGSPQKASELAAAIELAVPASVARGGSYLEHPIFSAYHSEHDLLRYMHRLQSRDLSLTSSMIALGSCTMKLNATSEMMPISWPGLADLHPFVPRDQAQGYAAMFASLEAMLCEVTGFAAVSLQPNAGSQGEYAGLLVIRAYHRGQGQGHRDVCLIPTSAHGTNPASAVMAGFQVVAVACDEQGNVDLADLAAKASKHADRLAALMITYPSTHGVFEQSIREICQTVHGHGGQVYMDGANMNAQVGLCRPGDFGADVCHLNLHKTFCIPHGGGGPGMGPIGVAAHLAPFLPGHPVVACGGGQAIGPIAAAPWGSASILAISYVYILMMGAAGLTQATRTAILNANYMAKRLEGHYPVLYRGANGTCAHEFILDLRPIKASAGIEGEDVAKRLMDYGFHAPTMSFPVAGTLMIEPTESEPLAELDRFCDAMIAIREEIRKVEAGTWPRENNPLKHAPHTAEVVMADGWDRPYTREVAAFPAPWVREHKFWPHVSRIDNAYGDRNLVCTCPPMEEYAEAAE